MARTAATLLLLWTLLLGPALCAGGLLEHACDCGAACEHEESCADDPCLAIARTGERGAGAGAQDDDAGDATGPLGTPAVPVDALAGEAAPDPARCVSARPPLPPDPDRGNLPYARSDRPLRI